MCGYSIYIYIGVGQNNWNNADFTQIFQWPVCYIKNIDSGLIIGVYIQTCLFTYLNSVMVLDMAALENPSSSAVFVTVAPAIQAPTIYPFSNWIRSCILS